MADDELSPYQKLGRTVGGLLGVAKPQRKSGSSSSSSGGGSDSAPKVRGSLLGGGKTEPQYGDTESFKRGGRVKRTGMAKVHKGERVLTAKQARAMKRSKKR